jgi:hypothetical protein
MYISFQILTIAFAGASGLGDFQGQMEEGLLHLHRWNRLKEDPKWKIGYTAYKEALKNGTATVLLDGEDNAPGQNALPSRPREQKIHEGRSGHRSFSPSFEREVGEDAGSPLKTPWPSRTSGNG